MCTFVRSPKVWAAGCCCWSVRKHWKLPLPNVHNRACWLSVLSSKRRLFYYYVCIFLIFHVLCLLMPQMDGRRFTFIQTDRGWKKVSKKNIQNNDGFYASSVIKCSQHDFSEATFISIIIIITSRRSRYYVYFGFFFIHLRLLTFDSASISLREDHIYIKTTSRLGERFQSNLKYSYSLNQLICIQAVSQLLKSKCSWVRPHIIRKFDIMLYETFLKQQKAQK